MNLADNPRQVVDLIKRDASRWELLGHVRALRLPDCWIGAGFIRDAIWNHLHGNPPDLTGDIDVIWFEAGGASEEADRVIEAGLQARAPGHHWSVKNQARMHLRNGDARYASVADAMRFWPETATAVAVRRTESDDCEISAPFGLDDLMQMKLRPAGVFASRKRAIFDDRVRDKQWLSRFPKLV